MSVFRVCSPVARGLVMREVSFLRVSMGSVVQKRLRLIYKKTTKIFGGSESFLYFCGIDVY